MVGDIAENIDVDDRIKTGEGINYVQLNAMTLPFDDGYFNILFEKKGALAQYISEAVRLMDTTHKRGGDYKRAIGRIYELLNEYFRVLKDGGVILIDAIPDKFAYITMDKVREMYQNGEGQWGEMSNEEKREWWNRERKKRIIELKQSGQWEEIQTKYAEIGLGAKSTLLQKSSSTWTMLVYLMKQDKEFGETISEKYAFEPLGEKINFLTAIKER